MSLLLRDVIFEVRSETYENLCETVNTQLNELSLEDKIKLEKDQEKIIKVFREQAEMELIINQRKLIRLRRKIFEFENYSQQNEEKCENNFSQSGGFCEIEMNQLLDIPKQFAKRNLELKQLSEQNHIALRTSLNELKKEIDNFSEISQILLI